MKFSIKNKLFGANKFNAVKFGLAGGITLAVFFFFSTILALSNIPGYTGFCEIINMFYGPWGYSVSLLGALIGALYGFGDGFIVAFVFAWVYNKLIE